MEVRILDESHLSPISDVLENFHFNHPSSVASFLHSEQRRVAFAKGPTDLGCHVYTRSAYQGIDQPSDTHSHDDRLFPGNNNPDTRSRYQHTHRHHFHDCADYVALPYAGS